MYKELTKRRIREKGEQIVGLCVQANLIRSPPATCPRFPATAPSPPSRRPLCYSCPAFFVDVKDNPPNNTTRLSLISSRYAAEGEIYGPFFCYPEHKSCIRIKVISLSSLSNYFLPTPDSTVYVERITDRQTTTTTTTTTAAPKHASKLTMTR